MALTEKTEIGKIEIIGEYKQVQIRLDTIILKDGVELSRAYSRKVIAPGDDYSNEDLDIQAICAVVHTQDVINAYKVATTPVE